MNNSSVWQISIRPDCLFHPDFSGYRCRSVHVLQIAGKVLVVRCHIDEAMAGQVEQDDFFARFFAFICFADSGCNGVAGLRAGMILLPVRKGSRLRTIRVV